MFLKSAITILAALCASQVWAEDVPGLKTSPYKLKSLVKIFKGVGKESRKERAQFCGERISPKLKRSGEKWILNVSASLGFDWADIHDPAPEAVGGCHYPVVQTIEKTADATRLLLINTEECGHGQAVTGSQRDTLVINGNEISYSSEKIVKASSGEWRTDDSKESFVCTWTAE